MKRRTMLLALGLAAVTAVSGWYALDQAPQARAATGNAGAALSWLSQLPSGSTNRVASGFFGGYSGHDFSMKQVEEVRALGGKYPAILGCDYGTGWVTANDPTDLIDYSCNAELKSWWLNGGLVTVSVRAPNPANARGGGLDTKLTGFDSLTGTSTAAGKRWRGYLDKIAEGLAELRAAGVPVIFRPLQDMNGDKYWWSGQSTSAFKSVWRSMYSYLTTTKGLNNLIWVYGVDAGKGSRTSYYPGSAYVDMVALDAFTDSPGGSSVSIGYQELTGLGKPFAFGEIGPATPGSFDYTKWLNAIKQQYSRTTSFLAWYDEWSPARNARGAAFMGDPWIVSRDEVRIAG